MIMKEWKNKRLTFPKFKDGKWRYTIWERTVWSRMGSADGFLWPYIR
jgi:REP element-mobilizing transposase RayT